MIVETENALIARINALFEHQLRHVGTHPGDWSEEALRTMLLTPPAVYVVWLGAGAGRTRQRMESHWVLYVVADVINGVDVSRLGLYQIVGRLISGISGFQPGDAGVMQFTESRNLYTEKQGGVGVSLYGLYFTCEEMIEPQTDLGSLDDFLRHWQTFQQPNGTPVYGAHITLPQQETPNEH